MNLIDQIKENARKNKQRIVLPESYEERTLKAADRILKDGTADIILIGKPEDIHKTGCKPWLEEYRKSNAY